MTLWSPTAAPAQPCQPPRDRLKLRPMTSSRFPLRIGTRGSPLALRQAEWVRARLRELDRDLVVEIVKIKTSGDRLAASPLREIGGKGVFVKEIEEALLADRVDLGVHSMKDMPAEIPAGLAIVAVPERERPGDVLVSSSPGGLRGVPRGGRLGTASLRRAAMLRHARPDLAFDEIRGNVGTRIAKWRAGEVDGLVLAEAGLRRLGIELPETQPLSREELLPAIGQGALCLEASPENRFARTIRALDDRAAHAAVAAERGFLRVVGGDCKTPIAAHAVLNGETLDIEAMIADPAGVTVVRGRSSGGAAGAESIGAALGHELLGRGGREILDRLRS